MAQRSKTLQTAVDQANQYLRESPDDRKAERLAIHNFVAHLLMEARSYRGFQYLYWADKGYNAWKLAGEPDFPEKDRYIYGPTGDQSRTMLY